MSGFAWHVRIKRYEARERDTVAVVAPDPLLAVQKAVAQWREDQQGDYTERDIQSIIAERVLQ